MKYRSLGGVVVAGCIAGVVAACAEPLAQGVGQAMAGAGGTLAGMGGSVMAGAGAALAAAGHAVAELGGAGGAGGTAHADTGTGTGAANTVNPRWVLRDKDGVAVEAMVNPYTTYGMTATHFGTHADVVPECVAVQRLGGKQVGLIYRLDTGAIATECNDSGPLNKVTVVYLDEGCTGQAYVTVNTLASATVIDGQPYYAEMAEAKTTPRYYMFTSTGCQAQNATLNAVVPLLPVPAPYDALPAAPYTLAVEY